MKAGFSLGAWKHLPNYIFPTSRPLLHHLSPCPVRFGQLSASKQRARSRMPSFNYEYECGTCWKEFPAGLNARENHCNSTGHRRPAFECDSCHRNFNSDGAKFQHMNDTNHFAYKCHCCYETWPNEEERQQHEREEHLFCTDCDRFFQNDNNIKMVRLVWSQRPFALIPWAD